MGRLIKETILMAGVGVMAALIFTSCNSKKKNDDQDKKVKTYKVLTLGTRDLTINEEYPATLQGRHNVEIRPKIEGYIDAIYVDEGANVRKGQLLFRISNPQYVEEVRNARAAIGSAEAAVETARLEVEKTKPLVEKTIVSQYELESAKLTLKSKQAALIQAKATLANAKANLGYSRIVSPVNGVIGLIPYKVGALVGSSSAEPLTTVSDISDIYAYFSLNEKQLLGIERNSTGRTFAEKLKNMPAVSLILSDGSLYDRKGKVDVMSGQIDTQTGSITVRATFPNPLGLLRNGGSATLQIPKTYQSVIVIPQSATTELQDKRLAFIVSPQNKAKSVPVSTIASSDGQFFIITEGLKAGDRLILEGVNLLKEGQAIKPKDVNPSTVYSSIN